MWKTLDICPSSIQNDPQVQAACSAIDDELEALYGCMSSVPGGLLFWPFVNEQVPPMLDVLAWEMHVDIWQGWEGDLDIETKRQLIDESIEWHRRKGTKWIVEHMLQTVFKTGIIQEWYQYGGNPYFFRVVTKEPIGDPERLQRVIDGIMAVKNVRSWMEEFSVPAHVSTAQMYVAVVIGQRIKNTYIPVSTNLDTTP